MWKSKVYKITMIEVDVMRELGGPAEIKTILENLHYPNHCMSPTVIQVEEVEIGEWPEDDKHPINNSKTFGAEVERLFPGTKIEL